MMKKVHSNGMATFDLHEKKSRFEYWVQASSKLDHLLETHVHNDFYQHDASDVSELEQVVVADGDSWFPIHATKK
jgi:hypothetical protein